MTAGDVSHRPINALRVFGRDICERWDWLILTPLPQVFKELCIAISGNTTTSGWYPTASSVEQMTRSLAILVSPGAVSCADALHFTKLAGAAVSRTVFVGLAGALDSAIPLGAIALPDRVLRHEQVSTHLAAEQSVFVSGLASVLRSAFIAQGLTPLDTICTSGSISCLAHENPQFLRLLRADGVQVIDLEAACVGAWCHISGCGFCPILIISDHPMEGSALWEQEKLPAIAGKAITNTVTVLAKVIRQDLSKCDQGTERE